MLLLQHHQNKKYHHRHRRCHPSVAIVAQVSLLEPRQASADASNEAIPWDMHTRLRSVTFHTRPRGSHCLPVRSARHFWRASSRPISFWLAILTTAWFWHTPFCARWRRPFFFSRNPCSLSSCGSHGSRWPLPSAQQASLSSHRIMALRCKSPRHRRSHARMPVAVPPPATMQCSFPLVRLPRRPLGPWLRTRPAVPRGRLRPSLDPLTLRLPRALAHPEPAHPPLRLPHLPRLPPKASLLLGLGYLSLAPPAHGTAPLTALTPLMARPPTLGGALAPGAVRPPRRRFRSKATPSGLARGRALVSSLMTK